MSFAYERKINYYETDKMGVVHHSNYIRFLEEARCYWLEKEKLPMGLIEEKGFTIPTLEVNCKYHTPVTSGETIVISIFMKEYDGIKMMIEYEITNKKTNRKVASAFTRHCFTNRELKPIQMKKYDSDIYEIFEKMKEE